MGGVRVTALLRVHERTRTFLENWNPWIFQRPPRYSCSGTSDRFFLPDYAAAHKRRSLSLSLSLSLFVPQTSSSLRKYLKNRKCRDWYYKNVSRIAITVNHNYYNLRIIIIIIFYWEIILMWRDDYYYDLNYWLCCGKSKESQLSEIWKWLKLKLFKSIVFAPTVRLFVRLALDKYLFCLCIPPPGFQRISYISSNDTQGN